MALLEETLNGIQEADPSWRARAVARLGDLTMPYWALGRLLDLAADLAAMTRSLSPPHQRRLIFTMAADHGVAAQGVSQYPSAVTTQMVANFVAGRAAVNALARAGRAELVVVDMGVAGDLSQWVARDAVVDCRVGQGTADISVGPAMTHQQARACVEHGIRLAREHSGATDIFATGEMGIGNTTPSAAICACITGEPVQRVTGRGTGIDDRRLQEKIGIVRRALAQNTPDPADGLEVLAGVGGFEIGGIAGLILGAARERRPVVVDGFISTAGALIAHTLCPASADYVVMAHASAERGHQAMCAHLGKRPLLDLDFRLGEGTGAALAMPLLEGAARVLSEVATFSEAGVSAAED